MRHLASLSLLVVLSACSGKKQTAVPSPPVQVDVMVAEEVPISEVLQGNGTVLSAEAVELHPETTGRVVKLDMKDGAFVKKGALLVKLNDVELQAQLRQQKVQLDLARKNRDRYEKMLAVNGINQSDYDQAVAQVAALEAAVDITQAQIDKTELRAPFDGKLGLRMVSPGAYVTPQTALGTIVDNGALRIDFTLPEQFSDQLKPGQVLEVTGSSGEPATAALSAIDPVVNVQTRNIKARAILRTGSLLPGAYVKVTLNRSVKGIAIPTQCLLPDAVANRVIVVKQGKGSFVPVKTGVRTEETVQITEGLAPSDSVIVTGVLFVRPNAPVVVRSTRPLNTSSR